MNKIFQIATRTFLDRINLKTLIFSLIVMSISVISFIISLTGIGETVVDLRFLEAYYSSIFLSIGIFWMVGIPSFLYFSYFLSNSISEDINSGLALLIFTRPIKRGEFLLGKFIGLLAFINLINGIFLFSFPAIANLFLGVDKTFLLPMLKVSFALFSYGFLLSFFVASLGIFLSSNMKKSLLSVSTLFGFILAAYFVPLIFSFSGNPPAIYNYTTLIKPFFSVFSLFDISLLPAIIQYTISPITNAYSITGNVLIGNFSPPILILLFVVIIPIILIVLAIYALSRQDIN